MRGVNGLCGPSALMVSCGNRTSMGYACIGNANFGCQVCRGVPSDVEPPGCDSLKSILSFPSRYIYKNFYICICISIIPF